MINHLPSKPPKAHLVATGTAVGLWSLEGLLFDISRPYTCCRICGDVFQGIIDRMPDIYYSELVKHHAMLARKEWSQNHAKQHSEREHLQLAYSGAWCTPDAAVKLASFGIIAVSDAVRSNEHEAALREAKAVPINDVEGA